MRIKEFFKAKKTRVLFIAIASVLLLFIIVTLLINPILNSIVKPKILSGINSSSLNVEVEDLSYSIFTNNLSIENLQLTNTSAKDSIYITADDIVVGINWFHLAFKDGYKFSDIFINKIFINQFTKHSNKKPEGKKNAPVFSFLDSLSNGIGYLSASSIKIAEGYFSNKSAVSGLTDSIRNFAITFEDVLLDSSRAETASLKIAEEMNATADRAIFFFDDVKYKLSLSNLNLSSSDQYLKFNKLSFRPYLSDDNYFKTKQFRADRFILESPSFNIEGLDFNSLVNNDIVKADNIVISKLRFDALTDMRLPVDPGAPLPEMPNVVLNEAPLKFDIKKMELANGNIFVKEVYPYDAKPGILMFGDFYSTISNFKNNSNVLFDIKTKLTGSGDLTIKFKLSLAPGEQKFTYSGKLSRMAATDLNKFIVVADRVQVMSGTIEQVDFSVEAKGDTAFASAIPIYKDLSINELDDETGRASGLLEKFNSFIANTFIIKKNNLLNDEPEKSNITYVREPDKAFLEYVWIALRAAIGDVVGFE